jgi:DNA-binding HxlR family transcriptional regulator
MRILWELRGDALSFRSLQSATGGVSPTVLNARLSELREACLIVNTPGGYELTDSGRELCRALVPLYEFAEDWGRS